MTERGATTEATRRAIAGRGLPEPGTWEIDPAHSSVGFSVRHATVTDVRGRFTNFSGTIGVGEEIEDSAVEVSIRTASLDTAMPVRDADVRGPDWLDAEGFPAIEFRSRSVEADGLQWRIKGDLTIRGETRPVVLEAEYVGTATTPQGEERAGFKAVTRVDRREFGVARNVPLATGGFFVGYALQIELDVSAVRAS